MCAVNQEWADSNFDRVEFIIEESQFEAWLSDSYIIIRPGAQIKTKTIRPFSINHHDISCSGSRRNILHFHCLF